VTYLYIVLGAVLGAPLRYFVQGKVQDLTVSIFPYGTMVVNLTACLLIGILATLAEERQVLSREARTFLIVGFLGAYSTFSSFGLETYNLLQDNEVGRAIVYAGVSTIGGILAVWAGTAIVRAV
jgi:CrcB protein